MPTGTFSAIKHPTCGTIEEREICFHVMTQQRVPLIPLDQYSNFTRLKYVTTWILRFVDNCRLRGNRCVAQMRSFLSTQELLEAETYWLLFSQEEHFVKELQALKTDYAVPNSSSLFSLHPILDSAGVLRVGRREQHSQFRYSTQHPAILHGKHPLTKLIIRSEHLRLLHAGPTLLIASLCRRYHVIGFRNIVRSVTRSCVICRRTSVKPQPQMMGQLPIERLTPGPVFDNVGVDYVGPVYIEYGFVRKPTIVKAYICVFVSLSVKAVHLEVVSDLTTGAFIASLRRFIARRGKPSTSWSDHGTNFVGAAREIKEFIEFLEKQKMQDFISEFCSAQNIVWKFIPERAPHFGGLWEAAVKSLKTPTACYCQHQVHLRGIYYCPHSGGSLSE